MLLVIDIGNTSVAFGIFQEQRLVRTWRLGTAQATKSVLQRSLANLKRIEGACVSSVVPKLDAVIKQIIRKAFGIAPLFVTAKTARVPIKGCLPKEIGADRLANAAAAFEKYQRPVIIVDFGTATTFDYVTAKGAYAGGAIAPGIELANESLHRATAKLPRVTIKKTAKVLGKRTKSNMQAGVFHGYVGLTDHLVRSLLCEVPGKPKVIATGGYAKLFASSSETIEVVEPHLTLEGLRIIWERNR